jgi:hypothetical protein
MRSRPVAGAAAAVVVAATVLSGCTSSGKQAPATSTAPASTAGVVSPAAAGTPVARSKVAALLERGLTDLNSVHLAVSTLLSGQTVTGAGDVALSAGSISRGDVTQQLPSGLGSIRVIVDGARTYAKLPSGLNSSAKPWVLLSARSSHVVVSQLAATLAPILAVASPSTLIAFVNSSSSVTDLGPTQAGGVTATHYRVVVTSSKLPATLPANLAAGAAQVPVDIYLDQSGRPVQMSGTFGIDGQKATPTIVLSDFNQPVKATPPPASDVDTG